MGRHSYFLSFSQLANKITDDFSNITSRDEEIRKLAEISYFLNDAGVNFISIINFVDNYELEQIKIINHPYKVFVIGIINDIEMNISYDIRLSINDNIQETVKKIINQV